MSACPNERPRPPKHSAHQRSRPPGGYNPPQSTPTVPPLVTINEKDTIASASTITPPAPPFYVPGARRRRRGRTIHHPQLVDAAGQGRAPAHGAFLPGCTAASRQHDRTQRDGKRTKRGGHPATQAAGEGRVRRVARDRDRSVARQTASANKTSQAPSTDPCVFDHN